MKSKIRDDVSALADFFPRPDVKAGNDLEALWWPTKPADHAARYATLLSDVDWSLYSRQNPLKILDVGCGFGLLLDYLDTNALLDRVDYTGIDLVEAILQEVRARWPNQTFSLRDIRDEPYADGTFDYCVICGIFTSKYGNTYERTCALAEETLRSVWRSVRLGVSFNSMSKHVDWERDDLFHWPLDDIMAFCKRDLSRHVTLHLDYGLWEVSTLVRKEAAPRHSKIPLSW